MQPVALQKGRGFKINIETMTHFGGEKKVFTLKDLVHAKTFEDLPENLRVRYDDVKPDANMAEFVCFSYERGVDMEIITARSGLEGSEVKQLIEDAKNAGIYKELVKGFLK